MATVAGGKPLQRTTYTSHPFLALTAGRRRNRAQLRAPILTCAVSSRPCGACTSSELDRAGLGHGIGEAGAASELELDDDQRADDGGARAEPEQRGPDAERPRLGAEVEPERPGAEQSGVKAERRGVEAEGPGRRL
jgi:hypothetical protein